MQFLVQKPALPYPARMPFSRRMARIGKQVITYSSKTPLFPISANLVVFGAALRDQNPVRGRRVRFCTQNCIKIAWKIACVNGRWLCTPLHTWLQNKQNAVNLGDIFGMFCRTPSEHMKASERCCMLHCTLAESLSSHPWCMRTLLSCVPRTYMYPPLGKV